MAVAHVNSPPDRKLTEEEFLALPDDGRKYELVDGEAIEVSTGAEHEDVGAWLMTLIGPYAYAIGRMYGSSVGCRMSGGNVRSPDVSVIRKDRLPGGKSPVGVLDGAPDLCVEIISPSEDRMEIIRKLNEYFDSGAQEVWHIYPSTRNVVVYSLTADIRYLGPGDELDGGELLPDFKCAVDDLFDTGTR